MIFLITDRKSCTTNELIRRIRSAAMAGADYVLLRENDMENDGYYQLALSILQILTGTKMELVICHRPEIAKALGLKLHSRFAEMTVDSFSVSTHTIEEIRCVPKEKFAFYGNVFYTNCKPGVFPKQHAPLKLHNKSIALGGISLKNVHELAGYTMHIGVMSGWLTCDDVELYIKTFKKKGY